MEYRIKDPNLKHINQKTRVPDYVMIIEGEKEIRLYYEEAKKYIDKCKRDNLQFAKITDGIDFIIVDIDDIKEAFKPKDGLGYKIKDKLLRNPVMTCMVILKGVVLVSNIKQAKKIEDLEEELEEMTELANDPSNAGRVLRSQRK